jgi:hypothetical protein
MPSATPVQFTDEEKEKLRKAKERISEKAYRERLREQRGVTSYAQRQAKRRAMKEAAEKKRADAAQARQARAERRKRSVELWVAGMPKTRVAVELGVSLGTVTSWLKGMTRPEPDPGPDPVDQALDEESSGAVADLRLAARDEEEQALVEQAEAHDGPADKYQAYVASMGIRMLRDNIKMVRGPRTIRELDALDQLIRRSLGLNSKSGGSGGRLNIDISILNNTKASSGALGRVVVEAEEV